MGIMRMQLGDQLQVEVYAHGGWWKDSTGRTGQVPASEARKGPLAGGAGSAYSLMVPSTHTVRYQDRCQTAAKLAERVPEDAWRTVTVGVGTSSENQQIWACLPLSETCAPCMRRWLLIRRSGDAGEDLGYFLAYGAEDTLEGLELRNVTQQAK